MRLPPTPLSASLAALVGCCWLPLSTGFALVVPPRPLVSQFQQASSPTVLSATRVSKTQIAAADPTNTSANRNHHHEKPFTSPKPNLLHQQGQSFLSTLLLSTSLLLSSFFFLIPTESSHAADYGSLTDEQRAVAEAWRVVDNSFLDRTFHGVDWFGLRQDLVVKRKYRSMSDAQAAIADMVSQLGDKYTKYLPPSKYQSMVDAAKGTLAGVGIEIALNEQKQIVASDVEPNAPASRAGVQPGDVFVQVGGTEFANDPKATPDDVALELRGPPGSKVGVVMERDGKKMDYILTREPIKITTVFAYDQKVGGGVGKVGVVRIKNFSGTTAETVKKAVSDLKQKGAQAIVFDLRGNPGGLLPGGVETASLFLDANEPVVYVVNKKGIVDAQATLGPGVDLETPVVILTDGSTASAAEVFTAALKENGRATVAGRQTFGKGVVQTVRELSNNNGGVAVTVARYETPKHNDINKSGIPVDVETPVDCPKTDATACLNPGVFKKATAMVQQ